MKPLFAFLSTFLAMAAVDQDHFLTALIFIGISVYLFTKSLPKWVSRNLTQESFKNYQSKPNKMTPSQPTSTGHSSSDSEPTGSSTAQTPTSNVESISNVSESNPASTHEVGSIQPLLDRLREIRHSYNIDMPLEASLKLIDLVADSYKKGGRDQYEIFKRWM